MSNDLVSLDDIIKKSKPSTAAMRRSAPRKPAPKGGPKANGSVPIRAKPTERVEDARFKIIQKKRKTITDARDKLAQIAKQSDARLKLQKLRSNPKKGESANISRKTGRNGRVGLSTNKLPPPQLPRLLGPGFIVGYRAPPRSESHYVNEMRMNYADEYLLNHQAALRRTVSNDYVPSLPPPPPLFNIKPVPYDWDKPVSHSSSLSRSASLRSNDHARRDYKVIPRSDMTKLTSSAPSYRNEWNFGSKSRTILPESALESKYYAVRNHRGIQGVKSRLDSPPPKSNRIASSSRAKTGSQSAGYRIVVSNLQPNVTQEDIKELFEDVGELLVSRLVRPGIAEVIYKSLKDASKAVETYHNRQLDGHPMKCLLVNPRPKASSSSSSRVLSQSRSSGYSHSNLGAVHRALFDN